MGSENANTQLKSENNVCTSTFGILPEKRKNILQEQHS